MHHRVARRSDRLRPQPRGAVAPLVEEVSFRIKDQDGDIASIENVHTATRGPCAEELGEPSDEREREREGERAGLASTLVGGGVCLPIGTVDSHCRRLPQPHTVGELGPAVHGSIHSGRADGAAAGGRRDRIPAGGHLAELEQRLPQLAAEALEPTISGGGAVDRRVVTGLAALPQARESVR